MTDSARRSSLLASRQSGATYQGAFDAGSGSRPRMMSAAFSPIMMVGALRLPEVIEGMIEEVDDAQRLDADHPGAAVDDRQRIARPPPSCMCMKGDRRSRRVADEGVDRLVVDEIGARLNLAAAIGIEGGLRENLARQPHAGAHFDPSRRDRSCS